MTKVTNNTKATQGFNTLSGRGKLRPGESGDFEMDDDLSRSAASVPNLVVEGFSTAAPVEESTTDVVQLQRRLDAANQDLVTTTTDLSRAAQEVVELRAQIVQLKTENDRLISSSGTDGDNASQEDAPESAVIVGLVAKHKGGGSYSVFDADDKELVAKLTKEQETEFNSLDDEKKTQWVAIQLKNSQDEE